jgi:AmmeMemoRadiSam system protein B
MLRQPVVAGQFYPSDAKSLDAMVRQYLSEAGEHEARQSLVVMAPHAGYPYSGAVAGSTLGQARLARRCILLGPNHTGLGAELAVWPEGSWRIPGADIPVDGELASRILESVPGTQADTSAHLREHSLEVLCPFLYALDPQVQIVPVSVAVRRADVLFEAGKALGGILAREAEPVSIVVSSDMSHYIPADTARELDGKALDLVEAMDGPGLLEIVARQGISMCGVLPMTMALVAAREMGATHAYITKYATSGDVSGDNSSVVGYAGAIVS